MICVGSIPDVSSEQHKQSLEFIKRCEQVINHDHSKCLWNKEECDNKVIEAQTLMQIRKDTLQLTYPKIYKGVI